MGSVDTKDKWAELRSQPIEGRLFIDGEFVKAKSGKTFDVVNPTTEKVTCSVQEAGVEDVDAAVAAAKAAFPAWEALGAAGRQSYVYKLADAIERKMDEMAYLDAVSMGRAYLPQLDQAAVFACRFFAGKVWDIQGTSSLQSPGMMSMTLRQPFGVTAGITPWNVPVLMVLFKMVPSILAGNTIVIKSSEKAPLSPIVVAKCCQEVGLPKGVFNLITGYGRPTGEALAKHMDVRKISFTGSPQAGRAVQKASADSNLKNVTLELGGKSPLIICEDADLEKAVPAAAVSILNNSGQVCIASSRIYVHENIASAFTEGMKKAMTEMGKSSDPLSEGSVRGPQVDKIQFDRVMGYLNYAKDQNLDITIGGASEGSGTGFFVQPTIISNAPEDSRVMREEIFGPVVCINTFTDVDDVLRRANDTEYGLYASVFTKDVQKGLKIVKGLEAGNVGLNTTSPALSWELGFGGVKGSGVGRELGPEALNIWTESKTVLMAM